MKSYGKDGCKPKITILDELHTLLRGEQGTIEKMFKALDALDSAYISYECGEHCVIVGTKDFSDWVDNNYDPEDD